MLIFAFLPMITSAQNNEVTIEKENGILTINILEKGDTYKIFKDDSLVYEGERNTFSEKNELHSAKIQDWYF